jgi:hypothetical protein
MEKRFRLKDKKLDNSIIKRELIVRLFSEHSGGVTILPAITIADYSVIFRFVWIRFQIVVIIHYIY